jgi:hypothetical protein
MDHVVPGREAERRYAVGMHACIVVGDERYM